MRRALALLALAIWLPALRAAADDRPPIVIEQAQGRTFRAALQHFALDTPGADAVEAEVRRNLVAGLEFSDLFSMVDEKAFLAPVQSPRLSEATPADCPGWRQIGADAVIQGEVSAGADGIEVEFQVLDVARGCPALVRKRYRGTAKDVPRIGKAIADDVVGAFTGKPGVSDTEIAFASNRTGHKEIYVMDADGSNVRQATHNRSINTFPDWSPSGDEIIYTSYRYRNRPWLFVLSRGQLSPGRILTRLTQGGPIYRGVFDPSGRKLALVRSESGETNIFLVDKDGRGLERLTRDPFIDVSPTFSPDGKQIAFVSDRGGAPQVYVMDADGGNQRRITFNGSYNTAPEWSPDGRWIAYESLIEGQFDIWLIDPASGENVPLVTNPRSDEHPTWAPDGRMLAFSSKRRGPADVYLIDIGTKDVRRLTKGGENTDPAWGPYRR
jgi:TolB protein